MSIKELIDQYSKLKHFKTDYRGNKIILLKYRIPFLLLEVDKNNNYINIYKININNNNIILADKKEIDIFKYELEKEITELKRLRTWKQTSYVKHKLQYVRMKITEYGTNYKYEKAMKMNLKNKKIAEEKERSKKI